jgi:hypothetical protein
LQKFNKTNYKKQRETLKRAFGWRPERVYTQKVTVSPGYTEDILNMHAFWVFHRRKRKKFGLNLEKKKKIQDRQLRKPRLRQSRENKKSKKSK